MTNTITSKNSPVSGLFQDSLFTDFLQALSIPFMLLDAELKIIFSNDFLKRSLKWKNSWTFSEFWDSNFKTPFILSSLRDSSHQAILTRDAYLVSLYPVFIPIQNKLSELIGLFFFTLTEKEKLDEKFIQSEKLAAIDQLAVLYNDQINSPLQVILGSSALMTFHLNEPEEIKKLIATIEKAVRQISEILRKMRSLSQLSTKKYAIEGVTMIDLDNSK